MATDRLIPCGPVPAAKPPVNDDYPVTLDIYGSEPNVNLKLEGVRKALWRPIPAALRDLLDIALYVYCADQATTRAGGGRVDGPGFGTGWRRRLFIRVAVRRPDLWERLRDRLTAALSFLSDDEYHFEFVKLSRDCVLDKYIDWEVTSFSGSVEEVVMFSGGLDPLAGAVQESLVDGRQILLVHHRSNSKLATRHDALVHELRRRAGALAPLHMPVWANKQKRLGREHTQRTRSILFAALGTMFAVMSGLDKVRFYENGVVSLNLPPSAQLVGARASRTTHPRVLKAFGELVTDLTGKTFTFENPFLSKTKTDVVKILQDNDCADMIGRSTSCAHTWEQTLKHPHCGMCSQCIDRRLAILAAEAEEHDPAERYATDPVLGAAPDTYSKTMLVAFMEMVERVEKMSPADFVTRFGELARVLRHGPGGASATASAAYQLYRRHAEQVREAVDRAVAANAKRLARRELPRDCLIRLVCEGPTDGAVLAPTSSESHKSLGNYFIRRGDYWVVRFDGGDECFYKAQRGFDYLRILLEHPRVSFKASELVERIIKMHTPTTPTASVGEAAASGLNPGVSGADDALDDKALGELLERLDQIEEQREVAEASDAATRIDVIDDLDDEARRIRDRLKKDTGRGGRVRKLGDVKNQVRNRVCNAITRALKQIDKYDKTLAAHLTAPAFTRGHSLLYHPDSTVTWRFCD